MMKKSALFYLLLFFIQGISIFAQSSDLLRIEYLDIPENDQGVNVSRLRGLINVPIKLNTDKFLIVGGEYNQFDIDFSQELPFDTSTIRKFNIIDLNLGLVTKWNENWRLISLITPRLASNFTNGIERDDFFLNATVSLLKQKKDVEKPFRIVLGLTFNSTTGLPIPLPLVSYYKRFHPNWSYTLGIPKSNFKYHPTKKHTIQASLLLDGFFVNVQENIELPDNDIGSRVSLSALFGVLGYQYNITNEISLYLITGKSVFQNGIIRNDDRERTFLLNGEQSFYIRTGFKISIF